MLKEYVCNSVMHGAAPIRVRATVDGERVTVAVDDAGVGIPEQRRHVLFSRFAQVGSQPPRGSSGLGLWIVRELATLQDGSAWFEPSELGGCSFRFSLPVRSPRRRRR
jgi:signal transduction histidine kinase